jgi:hypothetical protein
MNLKSGAKVMIEYLKSDGELFIVDTRDENWKGLKYIHNWTEIAGAFDVAGGNFKIASLLKLDGKWQRLNKIRIFEAARFHYV